MDEVTEKIDSLPTQVITTASSSLSVPATASSSKSGLFRRSPTTSTPNLLRTHLLPQALESTAAIMRSTTAAAIANNIAAPQSGSATGNPRNKCALKPGHSLMDWVRLGSSGCDLAGTNGVLRPVSHQELTKHNQRDDAWLAIRGKVYNVTRYMDFHPGGVDELMKGVGMDATKLFDNVHAWVNYEQLLKKCLIGPLRMTITLNTAASSRDQRTQSITPKSDTFKAPFLPFMSLDKSPAAISTRVVAPVEIIPRFDWIQKSSELTLVFYTKSLCNPGILVEGNCNDEQLDITVQIEQYAHVFSFQLLHRTEWPPSTVGVNHASGKIECVFKKTVPALWSNFGSMNRRKLIIDLTECNRSYTIDRRTSITHDSYALILCSTQRPSIYHLPIGYHISVTAKISADSTVTRSYTPIPSTYVPSIQSTQPHLMLLVKCYRDGEFTKHIGADALPFNELMVSYAKGNFRLDWLKKHTRIAILAAGSGITPMLSIIDHLRQRDVTQLDKLIILNFNKTEEDIWCKEVFDSLAKSDDRIQFRYILSQMTELGSKWDGETGRMNYDIAKSLADTASTNYSTYCIGCGSSQFVDLCRTELTAAAFAVENLFFFSG